MPCERLGFASRIRPMEKIRAGSCTMQGQNNWDNWGSLGVWIGLQFFYMSFGLQSGCVVKLWGLKQVQNFVRWWLIQIMSWTASLTLHIRYNNPGSFKNSYHVGLGNRLKGVPNESAVLWHTQYIHYLAAWNGQWPFTASGVCLCLLSTSSVRPLGWDCGLPCILSSVYWCASWRRCANATVAQGTSSTPPLKRCVTNLNSRGSLNLGTGCSEMYNLAFMGGKSETNPCRPFLYGFITCCKCL